MKPPIELPDPKHPDMSPEAIDLRLRQLGELYKLGMALRNPQWISRGHVTETAVSSHDIAIMETGQPMPSQ